MGIKHPTCCNCEYIKQTKAHLCKFPDQRGQKMSLCSGLVPYKWIYQQAAEWVIANYKTLR